MMLERFLTSHLACVKRHSVEWLLLSPSSKTNERAIKGLGKIMCVEHFTSCLAPNEHSTSGVDKDMCITKIIIRRRRNRNK
jgi:hypothetical protein